MGFSLFFMRIEGGSATGGGDREGLARFLDSRGLHLSDDDSCCSLLNADGSALKLDGHSTDLNLDPLDKEGELSGGIWHAHLGPEECQFIYDLCVAGGFIIVNPQDNPLFIVVNHNHKESDIPDAGGPLAWVESADELAEVLGSPFDHFIDYRDRVLATNNPAPSTPTAAKRRWWNRLWH